MIELARHCDCVFAKNRFGYITSVYLSDNACPRKVVGVVKTRNFEESDGKNFLEIFS